MHITLDTATATPNDYEALAAFVAVKRGLLTSAGRVDGPAPRPADIEPLAIATPAASVVAAAVAKADGIASTISNIVDDAVAAANAKAARDHADWEARQAAADNGYATVTPPPGVEVDKDGLPWDARIHAESKAKNADGSWRAKRKVDPALVASVTAELRAVMAAPVPPPPPPAVDALQSEAAAAFGNPAPLPPTVAVPPPPPPVPPAVPPAPVAESVPPVSPLAAGAETVAEVPAPAGDPPFVVMMRGVTARQAAGALSAEAVAAALANLGLPSIASLASRPDLIPSFEALLAA